jgi:hypothetical protein
MKTVKAELWKLYVTDGVLSMVHNNYFLIKEYYIPKYKISFNVVNDKVNVFYSEDRYKIKENKNLLDIPNIDPNPTKIKDIKIPEGFAKNLKKYLDLKEKIKEDSIKIVMTGLE